MKRLKIEYDWLQKLLPEGIEIPSSTLISGPGGSGKPLIAGMLLASYLKQGGSIIYFLINSSREYAEKIFSIYNVKLEDYAERVLFVEFDPTLESWNEQNPFHLNANLLLPENWDILIHLAENRLKTGQLPPLVFGAALNILLFSPTYRSAVFQKIMEIVRSGRPSLFTVSNNVFEEKMRMLENAADNLMFTRSGDKLTLYLRIERMKSVRFSNKEIAVPLTEKELRSMRSEAEKMRKHLIPLLKGI